LDVLSETGNTVCGRHPIGVVMAGLEAVKEGGGGGGSEGLFKFLCYERSGEVKQVSESSVSYASAFAVL
jgi:predicted class III extradiol MEMO1 family dioxygenase